MYLCSPVPGGGDGGVHELTTLPSALSAAAQLIISQCKKDFLGASGSQEMSVYIVGGVGAVHTGYGSCAV
jgi:hypothetical protein